MITVPQSVAILSVLFFPIIAHAQTPRHPILLADTASTDVPSGWSLGGQNPHLYQLRLDSAGYAQTPALELSPREGASSGTWAAATQVLRAAPYRGKRLMLTVTARFENVINGGLLLRADGLLGTEPGILTVDNMGNRPFLGTAGWRQYRLVLDIPPNAEYVTFGSHLQGQGRIWLADITLTPNPPPWYSPTVKGTYARRYDAADYPDYSRLAERALPLPALPARQEH